jgi:hypothetical protein
MTDVLIKRENLDNNRRTQRAIDDTVKKRDQEERPRKDLSLTAFRRNQFCQTSSLQNCEIYIYVI